MNNKLILGKRFLKEVFFGCLCCLITLESFSTPISDTGLVRESIHLKIGVVVLHGTLTMPQAKNAVPVVLLIAGSGPTDRDGNNPAMRNYCLKQLADALAKNNIATIRYDKRGVGESADSSISESRLRMDDYINDAVGWVELLRRDKRFSIIVVGGHSEGSLIGMIAAHNSQADAYISLSGTGQKASELLKAQLANLPMSLHDEAFAAIDTLASGKLVQTVDPNLASLFRPSVQPYLISWFKYDPVVEIRKLSVPILIAHGSSDIQISPDEARALGKGTNNSKTKVVIIEGMNHIFKAIRPEDQEGNVLSYSNPDAPIHADLPKIILEFITNLVSGSK